MEVRILSRALRAVQTVHDTLISMPYADPNRQREYQRRWMEKRRSDWFAANGPCADCGSSDDLQLDHLDFRKKVSHRLWSWSATRREEELAKCVARCRPCHQTKTNAEESCPSRRGSKNPHSRLIEADVVEIRRRLARGEPRRAIAMAFSIDRCAVEDILYGRTWKHVH